MLRALRIARKLLHDGRGASAVEYGLILAMIVLAMIAGLAVLGNGTQAMWSDLHTKVSNAQ
jgi:pilus assembly protein Flp/PilA